MGVSLIDWRDEFSLGISSVDEEHRTLIELINALYAELVAASDETAVGHFLGELHARISAHFALEERIMRDRRYEHYGAHKEDHERLLDELRDLMDDYADGIWVDVEAFSRALERWFTEHFRTHDALLHRMLE